MIWQPTHCPNGECPRHAGPVGEARFWIRKGFFRTLWNHQPVRRYQCKECGRTFSSHSFRDTFRQHKPHVNERLFELLASGVTMRRSARLLRITRGTVERKMEWLADKSRALHEIALAQTTHRTRLVQFDEMETFEHTKLKPLSIALAVRGKSGEIIEARVATMNCHGRAAPVSQRKYGWRQDTREAACRQVIEQVKRVAHPDIKIVSDAKRAYPNIIRSVLPNAKLEAVVGRGGQKGFDPLFRLNHTAAKIRADLSRMARKTWATTKRAHRLQQHLDIYVAWNNRYPVTRQVDWVEADPVRLLGLRTV